MKQVLTQNQTQTHEYSNFIFSYIDVFESLQNHINKFNPDIICQLFPPISMAKESM